MKHFRIIGIMTTVLFAFAACSPQEQTLSAKSTVSSNNRNFFVAEDRGLIFVSDSMMITSLSEEGGTAQTFCADSRKDKYISAFEAFSGRVYVVTGGNVLYSMAGDGSDLQSVPLPQEIITYIEATEADAALAVSGYTYDDSLYFVWGLSGEGGIWKVTASPLGLEKADPEIRNKTVAPDGTVFLKETNLASGKTRMYRQTEEGLEKVNRDDEKIIISLVNFSEGYLFYPAFDDEMNRLNVYKVSLDGSDKTQLFTVPAEQFMTVYYDNECVYLETTDGLMIIDKSDGRWAGIQQLDGACEIADGKRFYRTGYYMDIQSGEKASYRPQI